MNSAKTVLRGMRRRYRQARIVDRLRRDSTRGRNQGLHIVHMLHVRKTGGTAVKAALAQADIPPGLRLLLHGHGISLPKLPPEDDVFFFLRDPVTAFVSSFEMRRREGRPRHYRAWSAEERRAYARFASAQSLAVGLRSTDPAERQEAQRAMHSIYHVSSHLADWLGNETEIRRRQDHIIFIGWQERLDEDFASLVTLLGLPPATRLPQDPYTANRSDHTNDQVALSADAIETIRDWYAEDYALIALLAELGLTDPPTATERRSPRGS